MCVYYLYFFFIAAGQHQHIFIKLLLFELYGTFTNKILSKKK